MGDITREALVERFTVVDYVVFGFMLAISAGIGIFFGCFGKKMKDTKEFLMAGKSMTTFPVAMSLIASFMSAITLLGTPSEVYQNGFTYWLIGFSYILVMPAAAYLYLPVFWDLQVTSAYEYLEKRFNKAVRRLGSLVFITQMSLYMAIVVYAPALALSQVTGMNVYMSVSLICFVCIFYTTLGGMKAVLWTDSLQVVIMYTSMIFIIVKGMVDEGGFWKVWENASRGNRTQLMDLDPRPTTRHTFWTLVIGGYFTWVTIYAVNQAQVQRYLCVRKKYMAVRALWINLFGLFLLMLVCGFGGLVIYSRYEGCDPIKQGLVEKGDQLLPLFVMDTLGQWKGIPGLFVAGIFSGALSTVSSGMNSLAAIVLEDFVKGVFFPGISEKHATWTSKGLSLFFGLLTFGLVFVAERLGNVLSAALSIFGMVGGPLLGVFTLGMFFPWANSWGAFFGTLSGLSFTFWIGFGFQVKKHLGEISQPPLPVLINECYPPLNYTEPAMQHILPIEEQDPLLQMYQVSYMWYSAIATFTVLIVGMLISLLTGLQDTKTLNPKCVSPLIKWIAPFIPGGKSIGLLYEPDEERGFKDFQSKASLGGVMNDAFTENGHIKSRESSRL